jgi:protein-tyrosine phosphatase
MKYFKYACAFYKVVYDKSTEYINYYANINRNTNGGDMNENNTINTVDTIDDNITDYVNIINLKHYNDESNNNRIYQPLTYYETYSVFFNDPTHIIDNIFLGSAFNAATYETLEKFQIKLIINMTSEITNYFPDDFKYVRYDLRDDNKQSINSYLENAYNDIIMHQTISDDNILVHCYMGASRSASLVIYYIMRKKNYSFDDALAFVKEKRNIVNPTFRFTKDLARSVMFTPNEYYISIGNRDTEEKNVELISTLDTYDINV